MSGHGVPHHAENREQKKIGIIIAVIAVVMAIVAALTNNEANRMIVKEIQSSNGYAWYQAKRQRTYLNDLELKRIEVALQGNPTDAQRKLLEESSAKLRAKNAEYEKENEDIRVKAETDKLEAEMAEHRHHRFEYGEVFFHFAVVLCSLTLLTETKLFFRLGIASTLAGVAMTAWTLMQKPHEATAHHASATPTASEPAHK
ncbi:MAG: DUF4337 domain-containing protein [Verrucomicrobiota bacterium]